MYASMEYFIGCKLQFIVVIKNNEIIFSRYNNLIYAIN